MWTIFEYGQWKQLTVIPNVGFELSGTYYIQFTGRRFNVRPKYDAKTVKSMEHCVQTAGLCNTHTLTTVTNC